MYPHRIRLRGPWECQPASGPARRVTMPCHWADVGFAGLVICRRRFGYPGTIDPDERVWLTCAGLNDTADVSLNGACLAEGKTAPFAFDVTGILRPRNELVMSVTGGPQTGGIWGEVALEVRCTAYLQNITILAAADGCEVRGEVAGVSDRKLELYVLLNQHHAAYETITPAPEGRSFRLWAGALEKPRTVQVDLVNGATVWYREIRELGDAAPAR